MTGWRSALWKICGAVILVCVGVLVVSPAVNPDTLRDRVSALIQETTGLRVTFAGDIRPRFFPNLGVEMRGVVIKPPLESDGPPLATLDRVDVGVRLLPLLTKRIEIGLIEIEGLNVVLTRYEDGRLNLPSPPIKDVSVRGDTVLVTTDDGAVHAIDTTCRGLRLSRSSLRLEDRITGAAATLSDIALATGPIGANAPFDVELRLGYSATTPACSGRLRLAGKTTAVLEALRFDVRDFSAELSAEGAALPVGNAKAALSGDFSFDGRAGLANVRSLILRVEAAGGVIPDEGVKGVLGFDADASLGDSRAEVRSLALELAGLKLTGKMNAWRDGSGPGLKAEITGEEFDPRALCRSLGLKLPEWLPPQALKSATLRMALEAAPQRLSLSGEGLKADATTFSFSASRHFGASPSLDLALKADTLDLDRYLPAAGRATPGAPRKPGADIGPAAVAPVPVTASLEVGKLRAAKLQASDVVVRASASGAKAVVESFKAGLYGGQVSGSLAADLGRPAPALTLRATLQGVSLEPALAALMGKAALSGRLAATVNVTAEAASAKRLLETLNGKTAFTVTNGALLGVNLPLGTRTAPDGSQSVPFEKAWATVQFTNGVAASTDFNVSAPPHKALAHGWVNLPARTLDVAVVATVGGKANVPVLLSGSLDSPKVSVNAQALAKALVEGVAGAPGAVLNAPVDLGKGALDAVGNMLGIKKK